MGQIRFIFRASVTTAVTLGIFSVWVLGAPLAWLIGRRRAWRDRVIHWWGCCALRAMNVRVSRRGAPPAGGCLLVCNHLSYVDILVLAAQRPCVFVSKAEVAQWPGIGFFARAVGVLFIRREDKRSLPAVAAMISAEIEAGSTVVLFPEGTSSRGAEVLPFRASLLAPMAQDGLPVAYASLNYRVPDGQPMASESVCWWGDMTFADHLMRLLMLPHVDASICFGDETIADRDRKALAQRLRQAVQAQFEPVV